MVKSPETAPSEMNDFSFSVITVICTVIFIICFLALRGQFFVDNSAAAEYLLSLQPIYSISFVYVAFGLALLAIRLRRFAWTYIFHFIILCSIAVPVICYLALVASGRFPSFSQASWTLCVGFTILFIGVTLMRTLDRCLVRHQRPSCWQMFSSEDDGLRANFIPAIFLVLIVGAIGFAAWLADEYKDAVGKILPPEAAVIANVKTGPSPEIQTTSQQPASHINKEEDPRGAWGATGDFFGGMLNPAFSLIGLLMLLATLYQNQKELSLSRKELKLSSEALNSQAQTAEKQRFEDTFFSLLEQLDRCLERVEGSKPTENSIARRLKNSLVGSGMAFITESESFGLAKAKSDLLKHDPAINQLFRILYQILKLIASRAPGTTLGGSFSATALQETDCSPSEKFYSNLVRALLSDDIYYLLAVNASNFEDNEFLEYKLLVERFSLLEHFSFEITPHSHNIQLFQEIAQHYKASAFGKSRELEEFTKVHMNGIQVNS